jgi:phage gp46-like protein
MSDISFIFDSDKGHSDIQIVGGDFLLDDTLQTAVEISLFTDRRATTSEIQTFQRGIQERQSRRGYWANFFKEFAQGTGLWLLQREKKTQETLSRAKTFCNDSLNWMVQEGIVALVSTETSFDGAALVIVVSITKPDGQEAGFKYQFAWDNLTVIGV